MRPVGAPVIVILVVVAWAAAVPLAWERVRPKPIRDRWTWGLPPNSATRPAAFEGIDARAWDDWMYATRLLEMGGPLYEPVPDPNWWRQSDERLARVEQAMKRGREPGLVAIGAVLAERRALRHHGWGNVARFAELHGAVDLALAVRARHRPMGRDSRDDPVAEQASRAYADLCFRAGKRACFLNLHVQIFGDGLREAGIDVERFLRGLLYDFNVPGAQRGELGSWRLAELIEKADLEAEMALFLRAEAARPELDNYNRFRAAETLVSLRYQQGRSASSLWTGHERQRHQLVRDIRAELETLSLPPAAQDWISILGW